MTRRPGKAADRPDPTHAKGFVERLAATLTESGMPRMAARTFAVLLCEDEGSATAAELADQLQVSAAAISGAVSYLQQVGLIVREREIGGRRDVYRLYNDLWYEAVGNRDQLLARWITTFDEGATMFGADTPTGRRLAETSRFADFLRAELPLILQRWRETESARPQR